MDNDLKKKTSLKLGYIYQNDEIFPNYLKNAPHPLNPPKGGLCASWVFGAWFQRWFVMALAPFQGLGVRGIY
jgi:hypothetical protein